MGIESGRIAISTEKRELAIGPTGGAYACAPVQSSPPTTAAFYDPDTGEWTTYDANFGGQIYVHNIDNKYANLYIVVGGASVSNPRRWLLVRMGQSQEVDVRTGKPYDANLAFYSNLAS